MSNKKNKPMPKSAKNIDVQLAACNTLLTQLALIIDQLEALVSPINRIQADSQQELATTIEQRISSDEASANINKNTVDTSSDPAKSSKPAFDPLQLNWHYLLMNLKTVVLPEFYVVFNDATTLAPARRRLYDLTQAVYYTLKRYLKAALAAHEAQAKDPNISNTLAVPDSYVTNQGKNAQIALELYQLAQYIEVDGKTYIEKFEPYYNILVAIDSLEAFLGQHSQLSLIKQFEHWQKARLSAFGTINKQHIDEHPELLNTKLDHMLAQWMLKEVLDLPRLPGTVKRLPARSKDLVPAQAGALSTSRFKQGAALSTVGVGSVALIGVSGAMTGFVSIMVVILGILGTSMGAALMAPALGLRKDKPKKHEDAQLAALGDYSVSEPISDDTSTAPVTLNTHAYHLGLLLSFEPTQRLQQLIIAVNELAGNLDYLQSTYPYLATRVRELIKDLTQNTIVRLDELASRFVEKGQVNDKVRALFIRQHEARVDDLIALNLEQVTHLNDTILEKKMAVFEDIGSEQERPFREAIMELKILLRWLIAQQPDELQASSHQVILDNLESDTLEQMQKVFFDNTTTNEQREALLQQVQRLLTHFKQQSPYDLDLNSGLVQSAQQEDKLSHLLKLSHPAPMLSASSSAKTATPDEYQAQAKTQDFVDFNQAYVSELLKHWH